MRLPGRGVAEMWNVCDMSYVAAPAAFTVPFHRPPSMPPLQEDDVPLEEGDWVDVQPEEVRGGTLGRLVGIQAEEGGGGGLGLVLC